MALVPISYNLRSLWVRKTATLLTIFSVAATVAVLAGVISLEQGFKTIFAESGRRDVAVFWRPGATDEGSSIFKPELAEVLIKNSDAIALDESGRPIAAAEMFLAVLRELVQGGVVFVPVRGVQPMSFTVNEERLRVIDGRRFEWGNDEVIVGRKLVDRIANCRIGDVLELNTTPFRVVGVIDDDGPFAGEIWGDIDRMRAALRRDAYNRVIAKLRPDTDIGELRARQRRDKQVPADVYSELESNLRATERLSGILTKLGAFLALIMGTAAVFTGINSMLSAIASRTLRPSGIVSWWVIDLPAIMMPMAALGEVALGKTYSPASRGLSLENRRTPSLKMSGFSMTPSRCSSWAMPETPVPFGMTTTLSSGNGPGPVKLANRK